MALVNPNIALSYRPTTEYQPSNALAEYAQVQQIVGGQRQAEMADIQLEDLRRERGVLGQIAAAISAKGGPDLQTASLLMMKNPKTSEQGYNIYQALQKQKRLEDYERQYGGDNVAPTASMAAPAATVAPASQGELVSAPIGPIPSPVTARAAADEPAPAGETDRAYLQRQFGMPGAAASAPAAANALAPAAAPAMNAMLTSAAGAAPDVNALMKRYNLASRAGSPDAAVILKQIEAALRADPSETRTMQQLGYPLTQEGYREFRQAQMNAQQQDPLIRQYEYAQKQGFKGSLFDYKRSIAEAGRPPAQPRPEPAPRTQRVELSDGSLGIMNMDTGEVTRATVGGALAKGKPSAFAEKAQAQRVQLEKDLTTAIAELKEVVKPGNLIDQSTGSGAGRAVDVANRFVGRATAGDIAIGKLAPIADLVLKMVPRFEGPQSDKDTKSYKEAAGQLSDATLPREIRKQAANTIIRLMENRKGQFVTREMAAEGASASSTPALPPGFTKD